MKKVLIFISVVIVLLITIVYIINDIETIYNKNLIKENEICYAGLSSLHQSPGGVYNHIQAYKAKI